MPFALFNYSFLSYTYIVLALSSAVTKLPKKFHFHDFQGPTIKFHDFPGLENEIHKFYDFPGFPWPVWTLCKAFWSVINFIKSCRFTNAIINNKSKNTKKYPKFLENEIMQNTKHPLVWYNLFI